MSSKFENIIVRFWLLIFLVAASFGYVAQIRYDSWRRFSDPKLKNITYNSFIEPQPISADMAKFVSFGQSEFLANYYWLSMIQYYGGGDPYGKYRKLDELFNLVTDLSPKFLNAYQTGLIILPGEGFVDQAIALGKKGEKNLPNSWEMPYYTGLVYHIYKKDYISAAQEFQKAAAFPDSPPITQYFVGIYYREANQRQIAYAIFKTISETGKSEYVRDRAKKNMEHLEAFFYLEDAIAAYKKRFNAAPKSLDDLVVKKIIPSVPVSPLGLTFRIDPKTGELTDKKI